MVPAVRVSDGFFRTLGVAPILGRDFYAGEDLPDAPLTVILSHATWLKRFGGRADVIGQSLSLNGQPYTIVGVLPQDFQFAPRGTPEMWTTLHPSAGCDLRRSCHNLIGVGRLKDAVTIETARAEMEAIAKQLEAQYPDSNRDQGASVAPLADAIVGDIRPVLFVLLGGAALLLVIACVNVSSLLLVRSESRRRELAVRSALGASRGRLNRQFVTEALLLVALGCALGLASAHWGMRLLTDLIPAEMKATMPFLNAVGLSGRVLACAGAIAAAITLLCSLAPMLRGPATEARSAMADGERGSSAQGWHRLGFKLVALELATAMVLLVGAGLLGKSLHRLLNVDLGFQPERLATLQVALPRGYDSNEKVTAVAQQIVDRVAALPGVEAAGLASVLPVNFNGNTDWIRFVGRPYNGEHNEVNQRDVSAHYLETIGATLVRGRHFTDADDRSSQRVVIINQALARRYYPGEDPIGKRFGDTSLTPESIKEIVGVVADIREGQLDSDIWPAVYYPFNQSSDSSFALVVRSSREDRSLLPALATGIARIDPAIGTGRYCDDERPDHRFADGLSAPLVRVASRRLRRGRAAAGHCRALRRYRVYGRPTTPGDRRPDCARCSTQFGLSARTRRSRPRSGHRYRPRARVLDRRRDADGQPPLRDPSLGRADAGRGRHGTGTLVAARQLHPRPARGRGRSSRSVARRLRRGLRTGRG